MQQIKISEAERKRKRERAKASKGDAMEQKGERERERKVSICCRRTTLAAAAMMVIVFTTTTTTTVWSVVCRLFLPLSMIFVVLFRNFFPPKLVCAQIESVAVVDALFRSVSFSSTNKRESQRMPNGDGHFNLLHRWSVGC